jgi:hypothetical protein
MPAVERLVVRAHLSSPEEYRALLHSRNDEARAANDVDEIRTDAEIEAEVTSRRGYSDFDIGLRAVVADGTFAEVALGGFSVSVRGHAALAFLNSYVAEADLGDASWEALARRLTSADVSVTTSELRRLPRTIELTEETRHRLA